VTSYPSVTEAAIARRREPWRYLQPITGSAKPPIAANRNCETEPEFTKIPVYTFRLEALLIDNFGMAHLFGKDALNSQDGKTLSFQGES
jgi:hypothetical protein